MKKKFLILSLSIIFAIISNIANAANSDSAGGMFFLNSNSASHNPSGALDKENSDTDTGDTTGLSKNAKIALGIGVGMLVAGGITAAIIIHHHHHGSDNGETQDITIQADSNPANQHLQYRAFDIINNSTQDYTINELSIAPPSAGASGVLKLCTVDAGADCLTKFASTCTLGKIQHSGESSKLWAHSIDGTAIPLGSKIEDLTIGIQNTTTAVTKQQTFKITYSKDLYAGGQFTKTNDNSVTLNYIAKWNGSSWSSLGSGMDYTVLALSVGPDGDLYAGGMFGSSSNLKHIARWNGASWSALGSGLNDNVDALASVPGGSLYAGGEFKYSDSINVNHIAEWNGSSWSALGRGLNNRVRALAIAPDDSLYAGGDFKKNGDETIILNYIAKWKGAWGNLASVFNGRVRALAIAPDGSLYAGGDFLLTLPYPFLFIAQWKKESGFWDWYAVGTLNNPVRALAIAPDDSLYAGGDFTSSGGTTAWHIAQWKEESGFWDWYAVGNPQTLDNTVLALAIGPDTSLYVGGMFNTTYHYIAKWDGSWSTVGSGMNHEVDALLVAPSIQSVQ